jgi:hypothetical protein
MFYGGLIMSILDIQVTNHGIVMGADRNLTYTDEINGVIMEGQAQRTKVLKLPKNKGVIGYVGVAHIGGIFTDEWLQNFIFNNIEIDTLEEFTVQLKGEIEKQRMIDEGSNKSVELIIHIAGFEQVDGIYYPLVYRITNMIYDSTKGYLPPTKKFYYDQHIGYKNGITQQNIRAWYDSGNYTWFHQGFDLSAYNTIDSALKEAYKALININHPNHSLPKNIKEREKYVKMTVLSYGAYFNSFYLPNQQYVGGGADVISIEWPESMK